MSFTKKLFSDIDMHAFECEYMDKVLSCQVISRMGCHCRCSYVMWSTCPFSLYMLIALRSRLSSLFPYSDLTTEGIGSHDSPLFSFFLVIQEINKKYVRLGNSDFYPSSQMAAYALSSLTLFLFVYMKRCFFLIIITLFFYLEATQLRVRNFS